MQQVTDSDFNHVCGGPKWGSTHGSPHLQPTSVIKSYSSHNDDVRSLLYCSSDSDEIESLVFNKAEHDGIEQGCAEMNDN